ncbi:MAG TPA: lipopolysaccharide heptosyltransferase II [Vicinamibacterales bacterium]|nr:lipopolysaccharide heptosyltransferase II [Vicinamibacterales bacterium]
MADPAPARVVIRPPNWLGDAVLALPAIGAIRRHFASAHLTIAAAPAVAALFREMTPAMPDDVIDLPEATRAAKATLASGRFDVGVLFPNSFRSAWQLYRGGVRERWGYPTAGRGLLLTRRSGGVAKPSRHQADYYRALVRGLDIACGDEAPQVTPTAASEERAQALLSRAGYTGSAPLVVLLPGAAYGQAKQWPPARMAELASQLVVQRGAVCVLAGAEHDRPAARAIESWLRARTPAVMSGLIDLVGHTSLGALTALLARATVCVSNDSGGMHLASAVGCPVVAIFGPTNEHATSPVGPHDLIIQPVFCRPCMLRDCPIDHRCMRRITVDRVYEAASRRLMKAGTA